MVRLSFLIACVVYLWIQSLFVQTSHVVVGNKHVFAYGWTGIILGLGFNIIPLGTAWFLWRFKKDKVGAGIFLLCVPLIGFFVMPQLLMERVEVTPTLLTHRREPPHTEYNADIVFDEITSAIELVYDSGMKGYTFRLNDGRMVELPANTVLTAARDVIALELTRRNIPVLARAVLR